MLSTLFGHGAVHTLDRRAHRVRKDLFLFSLLTGPEAVAGVVERVVSVWDEAAESWPGRPAVVLFDEASRILTRGVCEWAGIPLEYAAGSSSRPCGNGAGPQRGTSGGLTRRADGGCRPVAHATRATHAPNGLRLIRRPAVTAAPTSAAATAVLRIAVRRRPPQPPCTAPSPGAGTCSAPWVSGALSS